MSRAESARRAIARAYNVPDRHLGIPTPWWRHYWHLITRRPW